MTNHYLVPSNLRDLKKMFRAIQQRSTNQYTKKAHSSRFVNRGNHERVFKVSFFDGTNRISCNMYWTDLEKAVDFLENKLKFERKQSIQNEYDSFLENMKLEKVSIYEHILYNEMKIDEKDSIGEENKYTICRNKYPYDFGNHTHFLLWIHPNCDSETKEALFDNKKCYEKISNIASTHREILGDKFIIFRNCPSNKSVQTIEHFHVICY
jgi:hypothetical protein